jgi:hypothetical protein
MERFHERLSKPNQRRHGVEDGPPELWHRASAAGRLNGKCPPFRVGKFTPPVLPGVYVGRIIFDGIATVKNFVIE